MTDHRPNPAVQEYLDAICAQVQCREVHTEIRRELLSHLEEIIEGHLRGGSSPDDAQTRALAQMGDPTLLGRQFHAAHRPRTEWGILGALSAFLLLGMVAMYGLETSGYRYPTDSLWVHKALYSAGGLLLAGILFLMDYRRLQRLSAPLYGATCLLLLAGPPLLAHLWTPYSLVAFTPWLFLVALAGLFSGWDWQRPWAAIRAAALLLVPRAQAGAAPRTLPESTSEPHWRSAIRSRIRSSVLRRRFSIAAKSMCGM